LDALLDVAAARYPDNICMDFLGRRTTYAEVARTVARVACGLQKNGVRPGTRVALFLPNSPQLVFAFFAVLKAGATVVNCNPLTGASEFVRQMADSGAEMIVTLDLAPLYEKAARALRETSVRRLTIASLADELPVPKASLFRLGHWRERVSVPADDQHLRFRDLTATGDLQLVEPAERADIAVLQYTGGTTGVPKAVVLSHHNLYANARQISLWFTKAELGAERIVAILPFTHSFGMTAVMNFALSLGGEMILLPRFEMRELLGAIERRRATMIMGVPSLFHAIDEYPKLSRYDLSSLKIGVSGGDTLPVAVQQRFEELTGCPLTDGYGLSECSPVVACGNPLEGLARPGSCGLPLPGTVVEIISIEDGVSVLPPGTVGEICVTGPQVMSGYWQRPEETAASLRNGRLHTGDVGRMDENGYLYFVDRLKEMIVVHGYKVYPRAVEEVLRAHPMVIEAAVIGIPDAIRGHAPKAFVVLRRGGDVTAEALQKHVAEHLAPTSVPREIVFRSSLPKSTMGKVLKTALEAERTAGTENHSRSSPIRGR
jgi:long-chain acyl-CoA synthetase